MVGDLTQFGDSRRKAELSEALDAIRERITSACLEVHRDPAEVELLAVTKNFPASDVAMLADLGLTRFAENREQEARDKVAEFAELRPCVEASWHMVGQLQRNKARSVARWADVVESVDSPRLVEGLRKAVANAGKAGDRERPLDLLVQVDVDPRAAESATSTKARGGCSPEDVPDLVRKITQASELRFRGVMMVAPLGESPASVFATLNKVIERVRDQLSQRVEVSAGMSSDLETAIAHGSTRVRVGTALLGKRPLISP